MLEDLDFADDLALLSHTHQHMQEKTCRLSKFGQQVGLQISKRKTEVMTLNVNAQAPVSFDYQALPNTITFTSLGSIVRQDGGTNKDIQSILRQECLKRTATDPRDRNACAMERARLN